MIPMIMTVAVRMHRNGRTVFLPIPLFLAWLILLPFLVLFLPLIVGLFLAIRMNPFRAMGAGWSLLAGLRGTQVRLDSPASFVQLRIQ